MAEEVGKFLALEAIKQALTPKGDGVEYFVDPRAIAAPGIDPVPCQVKSDDGRTAEIVVTDGAFTDIPFTVASDDVTAAKFSELADDAGKLFPGVDER